MAETVRKNQAKMAVDRNKHKKSRLARLGSATLTLSPFYKVQPYVFRG